MPTRIRGTKAARIGTAQGGVNRSGTFAVTAGQSLTFNVWAKLTGNPSWAGVGLDFLNASGAEISEINTQVTGTAYALRTTTRTVPAGAVAARIWTWKSGSSGYLFLDDFCVTVPDSQAPIGSRRPLVGHVTHQPASRCAGMPPPTMSASPDMKCSAAARRIGTATGTSFNVAGLAPATAYAMRVRARDAAGNWSAQSAPLT